MHSPGDAARCSGLGIPQVPQSCAVGTHRLPGAHEPGPMSALSRCPSQRGQHTPPLVGELGHPKASPAPLRELRGTAGTGRGLSVTAGPRALADRWRWRISLGDRPPEQVSLSLLAARGTGASRALPGTPQAPAPPACSSAGRGEGSNRGRVCGFYLLPRRETVG